MDASRRTFLLGAGAVAAAAVLPAIPAAEAAFVPVEPAGILIEEARTNLLLNDNFMSRWTVLTENGWEPLRLATEPDERGFYPSQDPNVWLDPAKGIYLGEPARVQMDMTGLDGFDWIDQTVEWRTPEKPTAFIPTTKAKEPPPAVRGFDWRAEQRNKHKRVRA